MNPFFEDVIKCTQYYNAMELTGMIGGVLFGIFFISMLPKIIRALKRLRKQKEEQTLTYADNKIWMQFLCDAVEKQKVTIKDEEVSECWDLFQECISTVQGGYGNWGGCIPLTDIKKLIQAIEVNIPWYSVNIGEDLFYAEVLPNDRLEVQLVTRKTECNASLMLKELHILKAHLQNYKQ